MRLSFTSIYGNNSLLMVSRLNRKMLVCAAEKKTQHTPPNAIYMYILSCVHNIHVRMCLCAESVYHLAHSNHCYWIIEQIAVCCCCRCCCCFIQTIHNRVYCIHCDKVLSWYGMNDGSVYLYVHNAPNPTFIILSVLLFSPHVQCSLWTTEQNSTNLLIMLCVHCAVFTEKKEKKTQSKTRGVVIVTINR